MLTKNGQSLFSPGLTSNGQPNDRNIKTTDGSTKTTGSAGYGTGKNIYNAINNINLIVGSGTTAATINDYSLESQVSSLTATSSSNSGNRTPNYDDGYILSCSRTFKNNTANDVTINELGLVTYLQNIGNFLIAREVLPAPVTIAPNASYTFSIVIS